ncbi:glycosyltransferase family 8 protein [Couchioplanes azureus]|uniref:glycosyltransferase family 8 protein n=1 Tax=Couchioplanes caeruleus TaxID=56438 RepID=UPI001671860C|nr:glycosyltransferase family 8 protein [Couchioplanes caeruleus]
MAILLQSGWAPAEPPPAVRLVLGVDARYLVPACVTLSSVVSCGDRRALSVDVLHFDLTGAHIAMLESVGAWLGLRIRVQQVSDHFVPANSTLPHISRATYLRLAAHDTIPPCDRMIYVDSDLLVRGDIVALASLPLRKPVGAVPDAYLTAGDASLKQLGLWLAPDGRRYFNAGVYLTDFRWHRRLDLDQRARGFLGPYAGRIRYGDQDAINVAWGEFIEPLHTSWNHPVSLLWPESASAQGRAAKLATRLGAAQILHFEGAFKPWHARVPSTEVVREYRQELNRVLRRLDQTGWTLYRRRGCYC